MRTSTLLAVAAAGLFAAGAAQAEYVIKFSHVVSPQTPKGVAAEYFAEQVNKRLAGKVRVEVFPNSQLYDDSKVMEAMRLSEGKTGIMAAPSLSKFVKFSNRLQAFDLPFLFGSLADVHKLADSELADKMVAPMEDKGVKGLAFWDNGMKVFSIRGDKPLRDPPGDFKGKKFRIQTSDVHSAMVEALGGTPQELPFKEVYTALGQGVVDGQENAWANVYSKKFHEVQDYISVTNHGYLGYLVVVSTEFWNGMPADLRKQVAAILREATEVNRKAAAEADTEERNKVAAAGYAKIVDLTPAEIAKWRAITASVEDKFRDEIGADLLKEIHALLGN